MRPSYAAFADVYKLLEADSLDAPAALTQTQKAELATGALLAVVNEVDATRTWTDALLATDASPAYGFGLSVANAGNCTVRDIATHACCAEVFVRPLERPSNAVVEKPRQGTCYRLPLHRHHFRTVLSHKACFIEHSGAMEATGVTLACRWLGRSSVHHGCRCVMLVDAQAVLSSFRKGRSSARTLTRPLRRGAAVLMATGITMSYAYIPSESNPTDAPSRGLKG